VRFVSERDYFKGLDDPRLRPSREAAHASPDEAHDEFDGEGVETNFLAMLLMEEADEEFDMGRKDMPAMPKRVSSGRDDPERFGANDAVMRTLRQLDRDTPTERRSPNLTLPEPRPPATTAAETGLAEVRVRMVGRSVAVGRTLPASLVRLYESGHLKLTRDGKTAIVGCVVNHALEFQEPIVAVDPARDAAAAEIAEALAAAAAEGAVLSEPGDFTFKTVMRPNGAKPGLVEAARYCVVVVGHEVEVGAGRADTLVRLLEMGTLLNVDGRSIVGVPVSVGLLASRAECEAAASASHKMLGKASALAELVLGEPMPPAKDATTFVATLERVADPISAATRRDL
jgi:hypothetical protein